MQISQIFDVLLDKRRVTLRLLDSKARESLRVQLTKKWSRYKRELDAVGFLPKSQVHEVLSVEVDKDAGTVTFYLRETIRKKATYEVITDSAEEVIGDSVSCEGDRVASSIEPQSSDD